MAVDLTHQSPASPTTVTAMIPFSSRIADSSVSRFCPVGRCSTENPLYPSSGPEPLCTTGPSTLMPGRNSAPAESITQCTGQSPPCSAKCGVTSGCQSWV